MEQIKLKATLRESRGKEAAKKMRRRGLVPGIVYHRGEDPVSIALADRELAKILHSHENENILINLTIENEKTTEGSPERSRATTKGSPERSPGVKSRAVLIKEVQRDPVKRGVRHVDFNEISLTETITVEVEVTAKGEPVGVKQDGGFLEVPLRYIKVQCLPTDIPGHIDMDVSGLKINDSIHVKDIPQDPKLKILTDPDMLLFQVKKIEEKVEETEPGQAPEVEVIREKKEGDAALSASVPASGGKEELKAPPKPEKK